MSGLRFTDAQIAKITGQQGYGIGGSGDGGRARGTASPLPAVGAVEPPKPSREPGVMNDTERAYAEQVLEVGKAAGTVLDYYFEGISFRLADSTFYHPDYLVVTPERFEVHEVKGFWRDDARVKIKAAQQLNPYFKFVAVSKKPKRDGGGWAYEYFKVR